MTTTVRDQAEQHRFEILVDGELAGFADYRMRPGRIIFTHAEVDDAYEGQGLASELAQQSLDTARERGLAVIPACPFYAGYIQRHPAYVDLVPEDERAAYDL